MIKNGETMTTRKQTKKQIEELREEIKIIYNSIKRDQRSLISSIRLEIKEVSNKKADLLSLKARISKLYLNEQWICKING